MIDYGLAITSHDLARAVLGVVSAKYDRSKISSRKLCVLDVDGSLLLIAIADICPPDRAVHKFPRKFMVFTSSLANGNKELCDHIKFGDTPGIEAVWANEEESRDLKNGLEIFYYKLKEFYDEVYATMNPQDQDVVLLRINHSSFEDDDQSKNHEIKSVVKNIEFNLLTPPTLYGCLLDYPAVYVVSDQDSAHAASKALSNHSLTIRRLFISSTQKAGCVSSDSDAPLLGFSVPSHLDSDTSWQHILTKWQNAVENRHRSAIETGMPWSSLRWEVCAGQHTVVL